MARNRVKHHIVYRLPILITVIAVCTRQAYELFTTATGEHDSMTSQSVVLECQQGSELKVVADYTDACYVFSSSSRYCNFGGFLINQL